MIIVRHIFTLISLLTVSGVIAQNITLKDTTIVGLFLCDTIEVYGDVVFGSASQITASGGLVIVQHDSSHLSINGLLNNGSLRRFELTFNGTMTAGSFDIDLRRQETLNIDSLVIREAYKIGSEDMSILDGILKFSNGRNVTISSGAVENVRSTAPNRGVGDFNSAGAIVVINTDTLRVHNLNFSDVRSNSVGACLGTYDVGVVIIGDSFFRNVSAIDTVRQEPGRFVIFGDGAALFTERARKVSISNIVVDSAYTVGGAIYISADTFLLQNSIVTNSGYRALTVLPNVQHTVIDHCSLLRNWGSPLNYSIGTTVSNSVILSNKFRELGQPLDDRQPDLFPLAIVGQSSARITYENSYVAGQAFGNLPELQPYPYSGTIEGSLNLSESTSQSTPTWSSPSISSPLVDAGSLCDSSYSQDAFRQTRLVGAACDLGAVERQQVSSVAAERPQLGLLGFPNPVESRLQIEWESSQSSNGRADVRIYNIVGSLVRSVPIAADAVRSLSIDVSTLPAGQYLVEVANQDAAGCIPFTKL